MVNQIDGSTNPPAIDPNAGPDPHDRHGPHGPGMRPGSGIAGMHGGPGFGHDPFGIHHHRHHKQDVKNDGGSAAASTPLDPPKADPNTAANNPQINNLTPAAFAYCKNVLAIVYALLQQIGAADAKAERTGADASLAEMNADYNIAQDKADQQVDNAKMRRNKAIWGAALKGAGAGASGAVGIAQPGNIGLAQGMNGVFDASATGVDSHYEMEIGEGESKLTTLDSQSKSTEHTGQAMDQLVNDAGTSINKTTDAMDSATQAQAKSMEAASNATKIG